VLAEGGDNFALKLCLDRLAPPRKDATVSFRLPKLQTAADALAALSVIADAVAAGEISPGEGAELGKIVDTFIRAFEVHDLATRLARIEEVVK
jgi:hypothetical protein